MKNKRNVLLIAYNGLGNSGVPNVISQVVKSAYSDYNFDIVVFNNEDYYYKDLKKLGANIIKLPISNRNNIFKKIWWRLFGKYNLFYIEIKKILKNKEYSIIHSFREYDSWYFFKAAKECDVKKRIFHTNVIHSLPKNSIEKIIYKNNKRKSLLLATDFVSVTDKNGSITFDNKKYSVLYNSFDEKQYQYSNHKENNVLDLLHVSTFSTNKNQLFSLEIVKEIKNMGVPIKLTLIGIENEVGYKNKILKYISDANLENNVQMLEKANIPEQLTNIDYYILPSFKEGASIVSVEAQASGMKIFLSDTVSSEVDCGGCVFLDLNKGTEYWAEQIVKEYKSNNKKRNQCDVSKFSFSNFKKNLLKIYKD